MNTANTAANQNISFGSSASSSTNEIQAVMRQIADVLQKLLASLGGSSSASASSSSSASASAGGSTQNASFPAASGGQAAQSGSSNMSSEMTKMLGDVTNLLEQIAGLLNGQSSSGSDQMAICNKAVDQTHDAVDQVRAFASSDY